MSGNYVKLSQGCTTSNVIWDVGCKVVLKGGVSKYEVRDGEVGVLFGGCFKWVKQT